MSIEREFVPYEQALALKELGFDEPCMAYYRKNNPTLKFGEGFELVTREEYRNVMHYPLINSRYVAGNNAPDGYYYLTTSPTFSQAFRWFREKYGLMPSITPCSDGEFIFTIFDLNKCNLEVFVENIELFESEDSYDICEEAELECLKELIKIVKNDKKLS